MAEEGNQQQQTTGNEAPEEETKEQRAPEIEVKDSSVWGENFVNSDVVMGIKDARTINANHYYYGGGGEINQQEVYEQRLVSQRLSLIEAVYTEPENELELCGAIADRPLMILAGDKNSGRTFTAIHLLMKQRCEKIIRMSLLAKQTELAKLLQKEKTGYLLEGTVPPELLGENALQDMEDVLRKRQSRLIVIMPADFAANAELFSRTYIKTAKPSKNNEKIFDKYAEYFLPRLRKSSTAGFDALSEAVWAARGHGLDSAFKISRFFMEIDREYAKGGLTKERVQELKEQAARIDESEEEAFSRLIEPLDGVQDIAALFALACFSGCSASEIFSQLDQLLTQLKERLGKSEQEKVEEDPICGLPICEILKRLPISAQDYSDISLKPHDCEFVLRYVWIEYYGWRDAVLSWLLAIYDSKKPGANRVAYIISVFASCAFAEMKEFLSGLSEENEQTPHSFLQAEIMMHCYQREELRPEIIKLIRQWEKSVDRVTSCLLVDCLFYSMEECGLVISYLRTLFKKQFEQCQRISGFHHLLAIVLSRLLCQIDSGQGEEELRFLRQCVRPAGIDRLSPYLKWALREAGKSMFYYQRKQYPELLLKYIKQKELRPDIISFLAACVTDGRLNDSALYCLEKLGAFAAHNAYAVKGFLNLAVRTMEKTGPHYMQQLLMRFRKAGGEEYLPIINALEAKKCIGGNNHVD